MSPRARAPVRLTFVVDSREWGGAEAYVARLLTHLPPRFAPTLLATRPAPELLHAAASARGAPVVLADSVRGKLDVRRQIRMARALRATRPDLVHLNLTTIANNRHVLGAAVLLRLPALATLHSVAPILSGRQRALLRRLYGRAARLIAVSEGTRRQLCLDLGVPSSAVALVLNGVEPAEPVALRDSTPVRIGGVGRLTHEKGFDVLVEAVARAASLGVEVEAVVAGQGPDRQALDELAKGRPIRFLGWVEDLDAFLASLDVFCLPSRWEGLPFTLLEAMMRGLPCVAADVGDVAATLGTAGIVFPPEDVDALAGALTILAASPARRRELGATAHARARERYSVQGMVEATARVYDEVLTSVPAASGRASRRGSSPGR